MVYDILEHYLPKDELDQRMIPLAVDARSPDYYLYLYAGGLDWYVVVQTDYLLVKDVPRDIAASFPVKVQGWCILLKYQKKAGRNLLPPHAFKNADVNESDEDWKHYREVAHEDGMTYALLQVQPELGVGVKDFGLAYYDRGTGYKFANKRYYKARGIIKEVRTLYESAVQTDEEDAQQLRRYGLAAIALHDRIERLVEEGNFGHPKLAMDLLHFIQDKETREHETAEMYSRAVAAILDKLEYEYGFRFL